MLVGVVRDANVGLQWCRVYRAVWHMYIESGDARAGCSQNAPTGPTGPWHVPGFRVDGVHGSHAPHVGGAVNVRTLGSLKFEQQSFALCAIRVSTPSERSVSVLAILGPPGPVRVT